MGTCRSPVAGAAQPGVVVVHSVRRARHVRAGRPGRGGDERRTPHARPVPHVLRVRRPLHGVDPLRVPFAAPSPHLPPVRRRRALPDGPGHPGRDRGEPMKFSVWAGAAQPWDELVAEVAHAEASGWDGVWLADHFLPVGGGTAYSPDECMTLLAGLAATVPRVRLGSLVCGNTYRNPAILVKEATTIDRISGGRFVLGLGAGWQQNEHDAFGIELPPVKRRLDMFEEACEVVKRLTTGADVSFTGTHYTLDHADLAPPPVQQPMPLLIGGSGEKRMLRVVATWADEWNT